MPEGPDELEIHQETSKETDAESSMRRGRPSKRTPELEAAILECLEFGMTIAETCDVCGVSETQFRSWRQHCPEFASLVRRGQAGAVRIHLSMIRKRRSEELAGFRLVAGTPRRPDRWVRAETHNPSKDRREVEREAEENEVMMLQNRLRDYRELVSDLLPGARGEGERRAGSARSRVRCRSICC